MLEWSKKLCINYKAATVHVSLSLSLSLSLSCSFIPYLSPITRRDFAMRVLYKLHTIHLKLPEFLIDRNFHTAIPLAIYHASPALPKLSSYWKIHLPGRNERDNFLCIAEYVERYRTRGIIKKEKREKKTKKMKSGENRNWDEREKAGINSTVCERSWWYTGYTCSRVCLF